MTERCVNCGRFISVHDVLICLKCRVKDLNNEKLQKLIRESVIME